MHSMKRGIFVGMNAAKIMAQVKGMFFMGAYAEEPGGSPDPNANEGGDDPEGSGQPNLNFEDLITKARAEEKAKQFKKIGKLEEKVKLLTAQHNDDLLKIAEADKKVKEAEEKLTKVGSGDSEELQSLKKEYESLKKEKESLESKVKEYEKEPPKSEEEIRAEVQKELEEEFKVKSHRVEILAEHKDDLLVPELVVGDTIEELDNSLKAALERSKFILDTAMKAAGVEPGAVSQAPAASKRRAKAPATQGSDFSKYSMDYLASLDPRSPEYREFRKKVGLGLR